MASHEVKGSNIPRKEAPIMVQKMDHSWRFKAKERYHRGGEGRRKETIYEGTSENIIEAHSSIVICLGLSALLFSEHTGLVLSLYLHSHKVAATAPAVTVHVVKQHIV